MIRAPTDWKFLLNFERFARVTWCGVRNAALVAAMGVSMGASADAPSQKADWRSCSAQLAHDAALTREQHRECVIAVAGTYLQWVRGDLAAEDLPLAENYVHRGLGTPLSEATLGRAALLASNQSNRIASVTEHEWFVDGDTAWAIFTVKLKDVPENTHWIIERFTVTKGLLTDIMAVPPVVKQ